MILVTHTCGRVDKPRGECVHTHWIGTRSPGSPQPRCAIQTGRLPDFELQEIAQRWMGDFTLRANHSPRPACSAWPFSFAFGAFLNVSSSAAALVGRSMPLPSINSFTVRSWRRGYFCWFVLCS